MYVLPMHLRPQTWLCSDGKGKTIHACLTSKPYAFYFPDVDSILTITPVLYYLQGFYAQGYFVCTLTVATAMLYALLIICSLLILYLLQRSRRHQLGPFPGPKGLPIFGCYFSLRRRPMHEVPYGWSMQYGDEFKFSVFGEQVLVISHPDTLHEMFAVKENNLVVVNSPISQEYGVVTSKQCLSQATWHFLKCYARITTLASRCTDLSGSRLCALWML